MINGKKVVAIIAAAGSGTRMGLPYNKLFYKISGKTLLEKTTEIFENCPAIDGIIVTASAEDMERIKHITAPFKKVLRVVEGGKTRQETVSLALGYTGDYDKIAVHDGARCFVTRDIIERVIADSEETGAAAVGIPAVDTIKREDGSGYIEKTLDRSMLWQIQTPQVFDRQILIKAYKEGDEGATDDAMLAESIGVKVKLTEGSHKNIKITTPDDLDGKVGGGKMRVGHGYDAHTLTEGRALFIGGVLIPHEKGLLGHSDADVLLHAICDALLGAAAAGDIGRHFPPSDNKYKDISSLILLKEVKNIIEDKGYEVGNVDATVVAQRPKLAGYIAQMEENIAKVLEIEAECVNIKATTTEKMGFEGREEGISATAVCVLTQKKG